MKTRIYILLITIIVWGNSCNDDFLEKLPVESLTEQTSFSTYDNFKTYAWGLYGVFDNDNILRHIGTSGSGGLYLGDVYAGYLTRKGTSAYNQYAFQTISNSSSGNGWAFTYVRRVNLMLDNIDDSKMKEEEKEHWRSVGYFFRSFYYMELIARFGDVPWIDHAISESDDLAYGTRSPRKEVADQVLKDLLYAEEHIKTEGDGHNTINVHCVRALISRFALFEGTWRRYHGLGDEGTYLKECARVSELLMNSFPTLYSNYDQVWTSPQLNSVPGIILYKEFETNLIMSRFSHYERNAFHAIEMPQLTVDMYLCQDGKTISNSQLYEWGKTDKTMYSTFRNRDQRLLGTVAPPYQLAPTSTTGRWDYHENPAYREYMDIMGVTHVSNTPGEAGKHKALPLMNWSGTIVFSFPNIQTVTSQQILTCRGGYYVYKHYCTWDENNRDNDANTADKPIFKIEEILLNYAEVMYELGSFGQDVADKTINKLRPRAKVANMVVSEINDSFDPQRDKSVDPVIWEIRRERIVELMGEGFGFYDVRRWKKADYFVNRPQYGMWAKKSEIGTGKIVNLATGFPDENAEEGYIYLFNFPLLDGKGWLDKYYLYMIPTNDIILNPNLSQNPGWN